jgi:hypothetical protein
MARWEYAELQISRDDRRHYFWTASRDGEEFEGKPLEVLNHLGNDGWEVIDVSPERPGKDFQMYTLKRGV